MTDFILTACITCRKLKDGVKVKLTVHHNKSTHGASIYGAKFINVSDIDHWIARTLVNLCSDVENLSLHSAIRALEVRHCALKNIVWDLLRGSGYAVSFQSKPYYNSQVYTMIRVYPLIKTKGA